MADRQPSLLTNSQREYLQEGKEGSAGRMARKRLKERVQEGLYDFPLLVEHLDEKPRREIFEDLEENHGPGALRSAAAAVVELLYLSLDGNSKGVEEAVRQGVENAERELQDDDKTYYQAGSPFMADVEIDISRGYDIDEIEERFRAGLGDTLSPIEAGILVKAGRIEPDEVAELENKRREFSAETVEDDEG